MNNYDGMNPGEKLEKIMEEAKRVSLKEEEKAEIKRSVISFIGKNRVSRREPLVSREQRLYVLVNPFRFFARPAVLVVLVIAALTGGLAFASENALPGDLLYPIKVNINENAKGVFNLSDEAKADFEAARLNRRIEEAEKLAVSGKLDGEARTQIEINFERSSERVKNEVRKLEAGGDFETSARVNSKFEASLKTHGRILEEVIEKIDEIKASEEIKQEIKINLNPLSLKVKKEAEEANDSKERAEEMILEKTKFKAKFSKETKTETEISVKKALKSAEDKVAESKRFVKRAEKSIGEEALAEVEAKIQDAEKAVSEGKARMDSGDVSEILILFRGASFLAQEAEVLAKAKMDLRIEIRLELEDDDRDRNKDRDNGGKGDGGNDESDNSGRNGGSGGGREGEEDKENGEDNSGGN